MEEGKPNAEAPHPICAGDPATLFSMSIRAGLGLFAWLVCALWFAPPFDLMLLWFGALALVPLAVNLWPRLQLPVALLLVAATAAETSGWLALPFALYAGACGAVGALRVFRLGWRRAGALADFGLLYFAGCGVWTLAYAMDFGLLGFPQSWALLTGAHQLYAGLFLQSIAARIVAHRPGRIPGLAAIAVTIGNPMVATGIVITHQGGPVWPEVLAAAFYASAVIVLGWMQLYLALWRGSRLPLASRALLLISDLSLGTAMTLALIYAWGTLRGYPTMTIPEMIQWHAPLNAFGFALCGLLGWTLASGVQPLSECAHGVQRPDQ